MRRHTGWWGAGSHALLPVDAGTLMIASEKKDVLGVFDFVCQDQTYRLQRQLASGGKNNRRMMNTVATHSSNLEQDMASTLQNKLACREHKRCTLDPSLLLKRHGTMGGRAYVKRLYFWYWLKNILALILFFFCSS